MEFFFDYFRNEKKIADYTYQYTLCGRGSYIENGGENFCRKCLKHAECNGGYSPIIP